MSDIIIRPMHSHDAEQLHELYRDPLLARTTLSHPAIEISELNDRVARQNPNRYRLVAELEGKLVGNISLTRGHRSAIAHSGGLGMMVHSDYWGQGIGSKLMVAILNIADNWLNLKRVELDVNVDNEAAIHLYQKFGFETEGTKRFHMYADGRWTDSYFMARIRERE